MTTYEEPVLATVATHKLNIIEILRDGLDEPDITEWGYIIEECGRFLQELTDDFAPSDNIRVVYSEGLNKWEVL